MLTDTDPRARAILTARFREAGGAWRLATALRMSEELRAVGASGVRARRPELTEPEVRLAGARLYLRPELADRVLGRRV